MSKVIYENSNFLLQFDGASRGNPGPASCGFVIFELLPDGTKKIFDYAGQYLDIATNNQAEYMGLYIGLKYCLDINIKNIHIEGDSNLVINQIKNLWKVKNDILLEIFNEIKKLINNLNIISIKHIYRDKNTIADSICNKILDERT
jgi:ribonuclease HI